MSLSPQDFVAKWKRVTARERQIYQEHFICFPMQRIIEIMRDKWELLP